MHTKLIAEGLFDVARNSGGRGTASSSPFDQYAGKLPRIPGRNPGDPTRAPDAFDVSPRAAALFAFRVSRFAFALGRVHAGCGLSSLCASVSGVVRG